MPPLQQSVRTAAGGGVAVVVDGAALWRAAPVPVRALEPGPGHVSVLGVRVRAPHPQAERRPSVCKDAAAWEGLAEVPLQSAHAGARAGTPRVWAAWHASAHRVRHCYGMEVRLLLLCLSQRRRPPRDRGHRSDVRTCSDCQSCSCPTTGSSGMRYAVPSGVRVKNKKT
jgi:hypothetical protein